MEEFSHGRKVQRIRVTYADTDAMGIVYHANYIKWFEIGRTETLRDLGIVYAKMESFEFNLPLSKVFCHYRRPARFDDVVLVETDIADFKKASIRFVYSIWDSGMRQKHAEGYTLHACATRDGKINRFPLEFTEAIKSYLARRSADAE